MMNANALDGMGAHQIALVSTDERSGLSTAATLSQAGSTVKSVQTLPYAVEWLRHGRPADMLVVSADHAAPGMDKLLQEADAFARMQRIPIVAIGSVETIDVLHASLDPGRTTLICDADPAELIAAISLASGTNTMTLADVASDMDTQQLRRLADEVSRIARTLASISGPQSSKQGYAASLLGDFQTSFRHDDAPRQPDETLPPPHEIRKILRLRRMRDSFFDGALFADPAWDILLDLAAAHTERLHVAVSSLCIAAAVPPTTALRWIKAMTDHGLLERVADPEDGRRIFIQLSERAIGGLCRYFSAIRKVGGIAI